VVIAIISLLVSVLLPTLNSAKELARSALCKGNMRSIGILIQYYANDWDAHYPPAWVNHPNNYQAWNIIPMAPYLADEESGDPVLTCPTAALQEPLYNAEWIANYRRDYALNRGEGNGIAWIPGIDDATMARPVRLHMVVRPASTILLAERYQPLGGNRIYSCVADAGFQSDRFPGVDQCIARHNEMGNFTFCDGHVDQYPLIETDDQEMWDRHE
jgi:prepilin-type processing-associated H-X9-DG protein